MIPAPLHAIGLGARSVNVTVLIPSPLRDRCGGEATLSLPASTVRAVLDEIERLHPDLYRGICDDTGKVRTHINIFVNNAHMRDREGTGTALRPGDVVFILPAVSGG
jgi:molybdopterin synthase sulfur carrier subunit